VTPTHRRSRRSTGHELPNLVIRAATGLLALHGGGLTMQAAANRSP
jgi:hypothetical protein